MTSLKDYKILLAVTGSIAAYKSIILLRLLSKAGAEVKVLMSERAKEFVGELSFSTLSGAKVISGLSTDQQWNQHVELGLWADLMIVAPATAQTMAKCAHGQVDNIITACYLSARCPVIWAPAMDVDMWHHPATQNNIKLLQSYGNQIIPVGHGPLASGLSGDGRLAEPEFIFQTVVQHLNSLKRFSGINFLVTAGPTQEPIDPVRFIGNHSSGKMGLRIAEEILRQGGKCQLVLGPVSLQIEPHPNLEIHHINTAADLFEKSKNLLEQTDVFVLAAAVADFRPAQVSAEKIKKSKNQIRLIELENTEDTAAFIGKHKRKDQFMVGFALETENVLSHAQAKLEHKNMDIIVINSPRDEGAAFGKDTNKISLLHANRKLKSFELKSKADVAKDILEEIFISYKKK